MSSLWMISLTILLFLMGIVLLVLVLQYARLVKRLDQLSYGLYEHFRQFRGRQVFKRIGNEFVNGTTAGDTIYLVLRSGTFEEPFTKNIMRFRDLSNTQLVVITGDTDIFFSNTHLEFLRLVTDLYENPDCTGVRAMLLEPADPSQKHARFRGYFFISNGHVHDEDEGFYTASSASTDFLHKYIQLMIRCGKKVVLPKV